IDRALPDGIAGLPGRDQIMRIARVAVGTDKAHRDAAVFARDIEDDLVAPEPDRAAALAHDRTAIHLAGNLPLALAQHVVDRGADGSDAPRDLALRRRRRKALRKFFGDEAGR